MKNIELKEDRYFINAVMDKRTDESDEEFYEKAKKKKIAYHYKLLSSLYKYSSGMIGYPLI